MIRQKNSCVSDILDVKEEIEKAEPYHIFTDSVPKKEETDNSSNEYIKNESSDDERLEQDSEDNKYSSENEEKPSEKPEDMLYNPKRRRKRKKSDFACEKCDNTYNSSIKLIGHCVREHGMNKLDVRPFVCDR